MCASRRECCASICGTELKGTLPDDADALESPAEAIKCEEPPDSPSAIEVFEMEFARVQCAEGTIVDKIDLQRVLVAMTHANGLGTPGMPDDERNVQGRIVLLLQPEPEVLGWNRQECIEWIHCQLPELIAEDEQVTQMRNPLKLDH